MKKTLIKLLPILLILMVIGVSFVPHIVSAENLLTGATVSFVNNMLAGIANIFLGLTSTLVIVSGIFLSLSINITTHIGDFFNSIPALKEVWVVVRNISSMFIIFMLLYTSISTILGAGTSNLKKLVGNIIMVGLLINFSLFFVKVLIDTSNLVSLQFYRAIAPNTSENFSTGKVFTDGGLSDVFMTSLKIPQIYQNKGVLTSVDVSASIFFATVGGMIMMITASISFFAAAIMFTVRTGILLFIMALSPLYFAAMIFPHKDIKGKATDLKDLFVGQLIFMPAYLFLMYISLRLISSPGFSAIFNQNATGIAPAGEGAFGPTFVGIIIQYIIALFFINAPLVIALKLGGMGAGWAPDANAIAGAFGRNSFGAGASRFSDSRFMRAFAAKSPYIGGAAMGGLSKISGASFGGKKGGYDAAMKAEQKALEAMNKKVGNVNRYDYASKEDYEKAKTAAEAYQKTHRDAVAGRSIMNLMVRNRAGQAASGSLNKKVKQEAAKKNKKANEARLTKNNERLAEIEAELKKTHTGVGFGMTEIPESEKEALRNEKEVIEAANAAIKDELNDADKGSYDDFISDITKANAGSGGGESKEEKPK